MGRFEKQVFLSKEYIRAQRDMGLNLLKGSSGEFFYFYVSLRNLYLMP
jgi:hypothetical protein